MFKSCKFKKFNFIVLRKFVAILLSLFLFLPFFNVIYAETDYFEIDFNEFPKFQYWYNHGFNNLVFSENDFTRSAFNSNLYIQSDLPLNFNIPNFKGEFNFDTCQLNKIANSDNYKWQCVDYSSDDISFKGTISQSNGKLTFRPYLSASGGQPDDYLYHWSTSFVNKLYNQVNFINGTYINNSSYNASNAYVIHRYKSFVFSFMLNREVFSTNNLNIQILKTASQDITYNLSYEDIGGYRLYVLEFNNNNNTDIWFDFNLNALKDKSLSIIPVSASEKHRLDNDTYTFLYGDRYVPYIDEIETNQNTIISRLNTVISNLTTGNAQSQQAETSMNNKSNDVSDMNNDITSVNNSYDDLESSTINNMTDALDNLSFQKSNNLINNADFLSGANWVKTQVDKIINDLWMIRNLVNFSLMIGIVLIFLGKVS